VAVAAAALVGCDSQRETADSATITVWDYYGSSTPIKPAISAFETAHPGITVRHVEKEYDDVLAAFGPDSARGAGPDVATLDLTWLSSMADKGLLADLDDVSGGKINGRDIEHVYSSTALDAMTYRNRYVAAPFDFDTYALYYRADLLKTQKIDVPDTWAELRDAARKLAAAADESGQKGKWRVQIAPDTSHFAQLLFQDGGALLDASGRKAVFAGPAGVRALTAYRDLLSDGGIYWGPEKGDSTGMDAIKDDRIAMFIRGPYMTGVLKDGVPDQSGKWGVAQVPALGTPGAERAGYLGGTALGIPQASTSKKAAWKFVQFTLRMEQQRGVVDQAGAAPTTNEAILSLELADVDPFFGDQTPQLVFLDALSAGRPMPRIKQWAQVDALINKAVQDTLQGKRSPEAALAEAAAETDKILASP